MNTPGMTDIGYRSSTDVLLNCQCVKCGTWLEPFGKQQQVELAL